jgi:hypothetical protein
VIAYCLPTASAASGLTAGSLDELLSSPHAPMLRIAVALTGLLTAAATATAQCSTLSITGTGAPGTSLAVQLDGSAAHAIAFLVVGESQATLPLSTPFGNLTLGVDPSLLLGLGLTNQQGDLSASIAIPANLPSTISLNVFGQAVTLGMTMTPPPPTFGWCASNVVGFHIGS